MDFRKIIAGVIIVVITVFTAGIAANFYWLRSPAPNVETVDLTRFDPALQGYYGVTAHGGSIYFSPYRNGPQNSHGIALRIHKAAEIQSATAWERFDLATIHPDLVGFSDAVAVGDRIWFVPYYAYTETGYRLPSTFAIYDTAGPFSDPSSWSFLDLPSDLGGLRGAAFHDGKLYVGRYMMSDAMILEIDPEVGSLIVHRTAEIVGLDQHYIGAVSAGECVYFTPSTVLWETPYGIALRRCGTRWESFDLTEILEVIPTFAGNAAFDGRYVYFAPYQTGTHEYQGVIVRHDTSRPLDAGWDWFDQRAIGASNGYAGAFVMDGYVGFVPYRDEIYRVATVMPLFSTDCASLNDARCWRTVELGTGGYVSGVGVGNVAFLSPLGHGPRGTHGIVARVKIDSADLSRETTSIGD